MSVCLTVNSVRRSYTRPLEQINNVLSSMRLLTSVAMPTAHHATQHVDELSSADVIDAAGDDDDQRRQRHRARRQKRSQSRERNVELMVAVDMEMKRHHGNDLEHYILTLLAIVSKCQRCFT